MEPSKKDITPKVRDFIDEGRLISKGDHMLMSLSAGKDSMALLHILVGLLVSFEMRLSLFHLNHLARAAESDEDEKFLISLSKKLDIPLYVERINIEEKRPGGRSFEEYARSVRYELCRKYAEKLGCNRIATAHNRDDCIETILMRIFTGTGVYGLRGIDAERDGIVRPLLGCTAAEIYGHCLCHGIEWREDSSNLDVRYRRNYIRNVLLPEIELKFPAAGDKILTLGNVARDYEELAAELMEDELRKGVEHDGDSILISGGGVLGRRIRFNYVLGRILREHGGMHVRCGTLDDIFRKFSSNRSHVLLLDNGRIEILKVPANNGPALLIRPRKNGEKGPGEWEYDIGILDNSLPAVINIPRSCKNVRLHYCEYGFFLENCRKRTYIFINVPEECNSVTLTNRREGDRIRTEAGTKKIKEIMIDGRMSGTEKSRTPILVLDGRVAAVMCGFVSSSMNRVSPDFHIRRESKKILALSVE